MGREQPPFHMSRVRIHAKRCSGGAESVQIPSSIPTTV
jgi:hypothetical protein